MQPRASAARVALLALAGSLALGAQRGAESVLSAEPPARLERLEAQRVVLLEDAGGEGSQSFIMALVLFERSVDRVRELLRQAERQPEYRPELKSVKTVELLPDGRIDEQKMKILFTRLVYRLRYHEDPQTGRLEWKLDETFDNDVERLEGFWEFFSFEDGRTLGRFGSRVDVGSGVPRFVQKGISRKTVLTYVENTQKWVDSGGSWRP